MHTHGNRLGTYSFQNALLYAKFHHIHQNEESLIEGTVDMIRSMPLKLGTSHDRWDSGATKCAVSIMLTSNKEPITMFSPWHGVGCD